MMIDELCDKVAHRDGCIREEHIDSNPTRSLTTRARIGHLPRREARAVEYVLSGLAVEMDWADTLSDVRRLVADLMDTAAAVQQGQLVRHDDG